MLLRCSRPQQEDRDFLYPMTPPHLWIWAEVEEEPAYRWIFNAAVNERCIRSCSWLPRLHVFSSAWSPRPTVRQGNLEFRASPRAATQRRLNQERPKECQAKVIRVSVGALTIGNNVPTGNNVPSGKLASYTQKHNQKNTIFMWLHIYTSIHPSIHPSCNSTEPC